MSMNLADNEVYMDLMNQRTDNDKKMIMQYNCADYTRTYPQSLVSMMSPANQAGFVSTQTVNPAMMYMLNPTVSEVAKMKANSSGNDKTYPPKCGYDKPDPRLICDHQTPYGYDNLGLAYNPTCGSKYINLNQDLNLQYLKK